MYKTEGRTIRQNKMIHALISDIVKHTYNDFEATKPRSFSNDCRAIKETLKVAYAAEANIPSDFSTAKLSKIQARDFISSIIEFCFQFDIPLSSPGLQMTDDINRYLFLCIKYRKCAVTGRRGEIHHVDSVGTGRDRRNYDHSKSRLICLSREMHMEAHQLGWFTFKSKYHVDGIYLSPEAVKKLNI